MVIKWGKLNRTFWTMAIPTMLFTIAGFVTYVGQNIDEFVIYDPIENDYSNIIEIDGL